MILAGYVGGALFKARDHGALGEAAWIVAAAAFGGGIALVSQMYNLSGDEADGVLVWCVGTGFAAAALRSGPLTAGAVLLGGTWMAIAVTGANRYGGMHLYYFLIAAVLWAVSLWTGSRPARHLILLSLVLYAILYQFERDAVWASALAAAFGAAALALATLRPRLAERLSGMEEGLAVDGFIAFAACLGVIQVEKSDSGLFLLLVCLIFAGIVAALLLGGRDNRLLRWLAYAAFGAELFYVYVELLGSMLGTAGFFLAAGVVLAVLAWVIARLERRLAAGASLTGAAA